MLNKKELEVNVARYLELNAMMKEMSDEQEKIKKALMKEMDRRDVEELVVGENVVRCTSYVQSRFDGAAFKKANPEEYANYQKEIVSRRFSVAEGVR